MVSCWCSRVAIYNTEGVSRVSDVKTHQVESTLKRAADAPSGYEKAYYGSGYLNVVDAL